MAESASIAARRRGGRRRGAKRDLPPIRTPEPWEHQILRLVAEQGAVPFDQLARFIDCEVEQAGRVAKHLTKAGYADYGRTLVGEPHWLWLSWRGARLSGLDFAPCRPRPGSMARMRAVNEVRLYIARRAPEARWCCRRSLIFEQGARGGPNAVVEVGDERHAIVVKFGKPQESAREVRFIDSHIGRYDAMICFAKPLPLAHLERLKAEHHWPKLVIRPIPKPD